MDMGYWENLGQLTDPEGNQTFEAAFYSEGCYPVGFPANGSRVSYTASQSSNDSLVPDTLLRWDVQFVGDGVQQVNPVGSAPHSDYRNFYFPHCGEQGITNVRRFERVVYSGIYPGIDLHLYQGAAGQKLALVCQPGSDPTSIRMLFAGASGLSIAADGGLQFPVLSQVITLPHPVAYQYEGTNVLNLPQENFGFVLEGNEVHFNLGGYDPSLPLVLFIGYEAREASAQSGNNGLCWSTYFGGNFGERIEGSSLDRKDHHYAAGYMNSSWASFPHTVLSPSPYNQANLNGFVSRFTDLDELRWTTVFGGLYPSSTMAYDVAVKDLGDGNPMSYVVGYTNSANFPVWSAPPAYFDGIGVAGMEQGFIFKVDGDGFRVWATYFGEQKTQVYGAAVGGSKEVMLTGYSSNLPNEQVSPPSGSSHYAHSGGKDLFAAMLNASDQLAWRTYYGGSNVDVGMDIVCSPIEKGVFYITGYTMSGNFPQLVKFGAYNHGYFGGMDRILLRFEPFCTLKWATCFGGPQHEYVTEESLEVDWTGDVYMVGATDSPTFPLLSTSYPGAFFDGTHNGDTQGFISRFNRTTQALEWSTFIGDGEYSFTTSISSSKGMAGLFVGGGVQNGSIPLVSGYGSWYYQPFIYPNQNGPITYYQDPFICRLDKNNVLQWSTYFGGEAHQNEYFSSLSCPKYSQSVLAYGETNKDLNISSFFPLQPSAWPLAYYDPTFNSGPGGINDCFITRFCSGAQSMQKEVESTELLGEGTLLRLGDRLYQISGVEGQGRLDVLNLVGQVVHSSQLYGSDGLTAPFNLGGLPAGVYVLRFPGMPAQRIFIPQ
ncbi:MAG TPA: hypothetical protein PLY76_07145 [Flavobacteriales bacterium]|nr:hypothetical protein [Flavobacteriales bacterium]